MKSANVLVIGASGAMGRYAVPFLVDNGFRVTAVSLDDAPASPLPGVTYLKANGKDPEVRDGLLAQNFDGIIDFLSYKTAELVKTLPRMLDHTGQYIFLSSGRVYANLECPVRETSPRLIDVSDDPLLLNSDDYCIFKARGENILFSSAKKNWTIVRPATTYSYLRYQLVTLEAADTVGRARQGKEVVLPEQAREKPATLSWGGDAGRMIGGLLFKEAALGESFNINSAEHHTWQEIADYYRDICGLKAVWVDKEDYIRILTPDPYVMNRRWQLDYARLFDRIVDNSKALAVTGMKQSEMRPLYDGLKMEIDRTPADYEWPNNQRMDDYLAAMKK